MVSSTSYQVATARTKSVSLSISYDFQGGSGLFKILLRFRFPRHRSFKDFVLVFMSVQKELILESCL
jgi:hypothetical protein